MIHINVQRMPRHKIDHLIKAAQNAQREINKERNPTKRRKLIEKHRPKWVAFRQHFDKLSHGKCWYTESMNPGTDDDVDHFRPKARLAGNEKHGGYYWLALTWRNFRLSCHRANRLRINPTTGRTYGKADHFPLYNRRQRAKKPADDWRKEQPLLLDPTDPFDPPKITFKPDGTVAVAAKYKKDKYAVKQVENSREYLHLDWPDFVDARTQLYNQITFKIESGEAHAKRALRGNVASKEALREIATELADMTKEDRPYSAAAHAYISMHRQISWVEEVVLRIP